MAERVWRLLRTWAGRMVRPALLLVLCALWYAFGVADGREMRWWAVVWCSYGTLMAFAWLLIFAGDRRDKQQLQSLITEQRRVIGRYRKRDALRSGGIEPVGRVKPVDRSKFSKPDLRVVGQAPPAIPITRGETDEQDRPG